MAYLAVLALAFVGTFAAMPLARHLAGRVGAVDLPKELGIHSKPTPRAGGVAIYAGWIVALVGVGLATDLAPEARLQLLGIALAGSLAFVVGFLDDARGLTLAQRVAGEISIGVILLASGVVVGGGLPYWLGLPISVFWFVGLMNAVNLLDGMDGLAAGVAALGAVSFGGLAVIQGNALALGLAVVLLGSSLAFLRRNVYPAAMFMGDGGSLFLGLQLAVLGVVLTQGQTSPSWLLAPIVVLGVPLLDTFGAVTRRLRARRSLFSGDRRHAYDLLAANGLSHPQAVRITWVLACAGGLGGVFLVLQPWGVLSAAVIIWAGAVALAGGARLGLFSPGGEVSTAGTLQNGDGKADRARTLWLDLPNKLNGHGSSRSLLGVTSTLARHISLRNRHVFLADCVFLPATALLAFMIRFDGLGPEFLAYATSAILFVAVAPLVKLPVLWSLGLYRQAWRYAGRREAVALGWAVVVSSGILTAIIFVVLSPNGLWELVTEAKGPAFPRAVLPIDLLLSLYVLGGTRLVAKVLSRSAYRNHTARALHRPSASKRQVLLVGAGDAGAAIADEMRRNPGLGLVPVGFIDDDPHKRGVFVHGLKVLGKRAQIPELVERSGAEQVLMTMPTVSGQIMRETVALCQQAGVPCRTVPGIYELIDGSVSVGQARDVRIEDLLRRDPASLDIAAIAEYLSGARVLVTGAGGSIGSELCRQIDRFSPELLVLLGHGENSIYQIELEMRRRLPGVAIAPVIADIRDADRMRAVMTQYRPNVVFHAAAHKHVPLMEGHAQEVVTNNVLGTRTVLREAERAGVDRFIFVSTDKAADPVNLLGATKRLGEMLVCDAARRTGRAYAAVRFGNVLGSRGSVVPLFLQQIAAGGPITVTHPEVARYFMTIPEAAQLIVQAGALSDGGEVFILDMGEPVKIVDLAADLIRLSGLRLGEDIDIVYTGLRPGEKMREILMTERESDTAAHQREVLVSRLARVEELDWQISTLEDMVVHGDSEAIVAKLREIVTDFEPGQGASVQHSAISYPLPAFIRD